MGGDEMKKIADWILRVLKDPDNQQLVDSTKAAVNEFCQDFPVPADRVIV